MNGIILEEVDVFIRDFLFILLVVICYELFDLFLIFQDILVQLQHIGSLVETLTHGNVNSHAYHSVETHASIEN